MSRISQPLLAFSAGLLTALFVGYVSGDQIAHQFGSHTHSHSEDSHYYGPGEAEVHVHADFLAYLDGERLDLSAERYMSSVEQELHESIHLHDGNGEVIHRHAQGVTMGEFFTSLGFTWTPECFTTDVGTAYCQDEENVLLLFANGTVVENPRRYVLQDEDQLLLYYGEPDSPAIDTYLDAISTDACIYSYTCPERGTPPPEACGLTCDV